MTTEARSPKSSMAWGERGEDGEDGDEREEMALRRSKLIRSEITESDSDN